MLVVDKEIMIRHVTRVKNCLSMKRHRTVIISFFVNIYTTQDFWKYNCAMVPESETPFKPLKKSYLISWKQLKFREFSKFLICVGFYDEEDDMEAVTDKKTRDTGGLFDLWVVGQVWESRFALGYKYCSTLPLFHYGLERDTMKF